MARKRRSKTTPTTPTPMSQDTEQADVDTTDVTSTPEVETATVGYTEPTFTGEAPADAPEEITTATPTLEDEIPPTPEVVIEAPAPVVAPTLPKDILRALLNRRNVEQVSDAQWAAALNAAAAGKVVRVTTSAPFFKITDDQFTPGSKANAGVDVLNNLVRGML